MFGVEDWRTGLVASRTEAWIETSAGPTRPPPRPSSPPARRRGLKPKGQRATSRPSKSPPARRRGLKQKGMAYPENSNEVASRTEAWIETDLEWRSRWLTLVASRTEAWIETWASLPPGRHRRRRLPHGGVD